MKKLIIFGLTDAAELALYYFSTDSDYQVEAFAAVSYTHLTLPTTPYV